MEKIFKKFLSHYDYSYKYYKATNGQYILKVYDGEEEYDSIIGLDLNKIMLIIIKRIENENSI